MTDPAEGVLDLLESIEAEYTGLYADLQREIALGLSELAQARLTNADLTGELKSCNFPCQKAHFRVLQGEEGTVELAGSAPKGGETFALAGKNPNLYRAKGKFVEAAKVACRIAAVKKRVIRETNKLG